MYGIISASRRWYPYCDNKIIFHTDHQPLRFIRNQKDPRGKIACWITELKNLDYSIEYIPGHRNVRADCLSRTKIPGTDAAPAIAETSCVYANEAVRQLSTDIIKAEQAKDKIISDATKQLSEVGQIRSGTFRSYKNIRVKDGILYKGNRIMALKTLQEVIIKG